MERVFLIFKVDCNPNLRNSTEDIEELHVLRISLEKQGLILEPWSQFKQYCAGKFTDVFFRHLYVNRTPQFLQSSTEFVDAVLENGLVPINPEVDLNQSNDFTKKKAIKTVDEALQLGFRALRNPEIVARYYQAVGLVKKHTFMRSKGDDQY